MTTLDQAALLSGKTFAEVLNFCMTMRIPHSVFHDQIRMHDTDGTDAVFGFQDGACIMQAVGMPVVKQSNYCKPQGNRVDWKTPVAKSYKRESQCSIDNYSVAPDGERYGYTAYGAGG